MQYDNNNMMQLIEEFDVDKVKCALENLATIDEEAACNIGQLMGPIEKLLAMQTSVKALNTLTPKQLSDAYQKANAYYESGNVSKASELFHALTIVTPTDKQAWFGLGACQEHQQNYADAIDSYTEATAQDPQDPRPWLRRAQCHLALKAPDCAYDHFNEALKHVTKDNQDAHLTKEIQLLAAKLDRHTAGNTTTDAPTSNPSEQRE